MAINHRVNQINIFGRMLQNINKSEKGGFTMKIFKLFLAAMLLMLLGCTNGNGGGNGKEPDGNIVNGCVEGVEIPRGSLAQRGGVRVNHGNVKEFLELFEDAFRNEGGSSVQMPDQDGWEIWVRHGLYGRSEERSKELAEDVILYVKELSDFSENGRLFVGGGQVDVENAGNNQCVVARFQFNGEFSGEIVYDNISLSFEYNDSGFVMRRTGGKATVNDIDITDLVFPEITVICYFGEDENGKCLTSSSFTGGLNGN